MMNSRSRLVFDCGTVPHGQILLFGGGGGADPVFRGARSVVGLDEARGVKRPFFTTADDLWEEEYYDDQMPEKKRRLTAEQVLMLERSFDEENKLEPDRKNELAKKLGLQPRQIAVWFQNRRARWKTKNLEQEYDRLKSSYDALRTSHESALKENDLLQNKVHELTKLLVARGVHLDEHSTVMAEEATAIVDQSSPPAAQLQMGTRAEDLTSAGTTGSAVVDAEGTHHNGNLYYKVDVGGVQSEDDSVSDGGCNFFPDQDLIENQHIIDDVENFNFWDWGCTV